jgi:hypothetical protein
MSDRKSFALTCLIALMALHAAAANGDAPPPPRSSASGPVGPPPEAIAACVGKSEGTSVSFTGRHGETFNGVCRLIGGVLAATPQQRHVHMNLKDGNSFSQLVAWVSGR